MEGGRSGAELGRVVPTGAEAARRGGGKRSGVGQIQATIVVQSLCDSDKSIHLSEPQMYVDFDLMLPGDLVRGEHSDSQKIPR